MIDLAKKKTAVEVASTAYLAPSYSWSSRLWEQIQLATAQQSGTEFAPVRTRSHRDTETGIRKHVTTVKRVKQWWFVAENGKLIVNVRYGTRWIELAKGKKSMSWLARLIWCPRWS